MYLLFYVNAKLCFPVTGKCAGVRSEVNSRPRKKWQDDGENCTVKGMIYTLRKVLSRRMQWDAEADGMEMLEMHTKLQSENQKKSHIQE